MAKKNQPKEPLFIKRHIEIKTFECNGVNISVKTDFDMEQISLVENSGSNLSPNWQPKKWLFACRELHYMDGWQKIVSAMQNAIALATEELKSYIKVRNAYDALVESILAHKKNND